MNFKLTITLPSGIAPVVEYGRHFNVWGEIIHDEELPEDSIIRVSLLDASGREVRHVSQNKKNNDNLYLEHPDLTCYKEDLDPDKKGLIRYGFPELMVRDKTRPLESLRDATIKAFFSDNKYKAVIVAASGTDQGLIWDDGMNLVDETGKPYEMLPCGDYTVLVQLLTSSGNLLAEAKKAIVISRRKTQTIVRFNPIEHRNNMKAWCKNVGFEIIDDTFPGYLEPYLGKWYYHMGLLPMYRACDIALYQDSDIHMFVYLIDPTSTSYETELGYLQSKGIVGNPEKFRAYHYDIGEAVLKKNGEVIKRGEIKEFFETEYLSIYRVDLVNEEAEENKFYLNGNNVEEYITDLTDIKINAGSRIAISGVTKPWQLDTESFRLKRDNTYIIEDSICEIHYEISDLEKGELIRKETRKLMMERMEDESIGSSVYEFYNIFNIDNELKGRRIRIKLIACDKKGEKEGSEGIVDITVL